MIQAMVLAAGLGTRLLPLTKERPKALVEIAGVSLLERLIRKLKSAGITAIVINIHHLGDQVLRFLDERSNFGLHIQVSDERGQLLDSGGGIQQAKRLFTAGSPVLVHNVDVISDLDLKQFMDFHLQNDALASLAISERPSQRFFLFDDSRQLIGWENTGSGEKRMVGNAPGKSCKRLAFSGIYILSPEFLQGMQHQGPYSILEALLQQAGEGKVLGYDHTGDFWLDAGTAGQLAAAEAYYQGLSNTNI